MKVAIYGAGAVGGFLGSLLAKQGCAVSAIARGATAAALRRDGIRLEIDGQVLAAKIAVSEDSTELGAQDLVIVAVKAPSLAAIAPHIVPLLGRDTILLPAMNGVPWWFFQKFGGAAQGMALESVDPGGAIAAALPARHIVGAVLHLTCVATAPGVVRHGMGKRMIVGEPGGGTSPRVAALARLFTQAGLAAEIAPSIEKEIWYKLWGNATMNPISALTGATCDLILDDPLLEKFILGAMDEAAGVGAKIGCVIGETGAHRNAVTRELGAFKTSMLRDHEAGRPLEIDALLSALHEIGGKLGIATPSLDAILGLIRVQQRSRGLYR
jgi:2-dehydropantoate 2-reductase